MGGDHGLEAEDGIGVGVGAGAVDAENGSGGRAGEINGDLAVPDGEFRPDGDRPLVAIERHGVGPLAFGHGPDGFAGALFRGGENVSCQRFQTRELELVHHLDKASGACVIGADQREQVAAHFNRVP